MLCYASSFDKSHLLLLLSQTEFHIVSGNYERATEFRDQALALFKKLGSENDLKIISKLHAISHAYSERGMYSDAVKTESLLVEVFPLAMPDNKYDYALYLADLSLYLLDDDNIELAEHNIRKALALIRDEKDINEKLALIYIRAAEIYFETTPQRVDLSVQYQKKAVVIYGDKLGKTSSKYLLELSYLAKYYERAEEYDNACNSYLEVLHTRVDDDEQDIQSLLSVLDRIIVCSRKIGNTELEKQSKEKAFAIKLAIQQQDFHEAKYTTTEFPSQRDSMEYIRISKTLSSYRLIDDDGDEIKQKQKQEEIIQYVATLPDSYGKAYSMTIESLRNSLENNWHAVIEYGSEALRIFDKLGIVSDKYVITLCCIAEAYHELDNPSKAYDYILRAYELRDDYLSSDNIYYNGIPNDLALYCSDMGNYIEAIKYGLMVVETKEPLIYSDNSYGYFHAINNLATYYMGLGQFDVALSRLQFLVKRAEEIAPYVLEYPESSIMFNLAICYLRNGDYDQSIETGLKVKEIREKWGKETYIANIYRMLAEAYFRKGKMKEALDYAHLANQIQNKIGGNDNLALSDTYYLLAEIFKKRGEYEVAERMSRNTINLLYNNVINNFINLPSDDRTSYWSNFSPLFNIWYPNYFYQAKTKDASELYNKSALFAKGILLNADIELSKLIKASGDDNVITKYQQLLHNRNMLATISSGEKPLQEKAYTDSLRVSTDKIERELIKESKSFGDYTKSMRTTWQDVQVALKPNDIAIEFLLFPLIDNNQISTTIYTALILRKNDKTPLFVLLCDEEELEQIENNNIYDEKLYHLIWGPLDKYLVGIDNVYFSPSGKLYNINIEALPEIVGVNNEKNYYRVSSTRLLAQIKDTVQTTAENAILYGGLQYETSIAGLIADSKQHMKADIAYRGNVEKLDLRYGWDFLPETLTEVHAIGKVFKKCSIPTQIYTDTLGTEASFKSLDGQSCKIIHIATHGFYYTENDIAKMKQMRLDYMANQIDEHSRSYVEDLSLTRSGLLMAGCNNVIRGYDLPNNIDDGILFAKEIAGMNLKNVELITLSSCDSGLGDVTGEGVFGLQRAFKKAGAHSIMMSLHKVDDEATRILMVEFYKNLMRGQTKLESLREAQKYLRKVEDGKYDDPKYWASFIMLDGID